MSRTVYGGARLRHGSVSGCWWGVVCAALRACCGRRRPRSGGRPQPPTTPSFPPSTTATTRPPWSVPGRVAGRDQDAAVALDRLDLLRDDGAASATTRWAVCDKALEHYTAALELYLAFPNWMVQVQFPPPIRPTRAAPQAAVPGRRGALQAPLGSYPTAMLIGQGQIDITTHASSRAAWLQQADALPDRAAGDRPLHGAGHPPPGGAAGPAGGRTTRCSTTLIVGPVAAARSAQPLVRGLGEPGVGPGPGGRRPGRGRPSPACSGPCWPAASSTIR